MIHSWCKLALLGSVLAMSGGCYVREEVRPARPCEGGVWVAGYRGPRGGWHPGHWRCPGIREVIEVD